MKSRGRKKQKKLLINEGVTSPAEYPKQLVGSPHRKLPWRFQEKREKLMIMKIL